MRQFIAFMVIIYIVVAAFVAFGYYFNDSNSTYAQQEIWMDAASEGMATKRVLVNAVSATTVR